jgi:hypothetical protein
VPTVGPRTGQQRGTPDRVADQRGQHRLDGADERDRCPQRGGEEPQLTVAPEATRVEGDGRAAESATGEFEDESRPHRAADGVHGLQAILLEEGLQRVRQRRDRHLARQGR